MKKKRKKCKGKGLTGLTMFRKLNICLLASFFLILSFSLPFVSAALNVQLSDQGTGVAYNNGTTLDSADLTVLIYDASSGGSLIYNETFTNNITNGSWNVMLGSGVNLPLEFGRVYYKDYLIAGEDASFDGSDRQLFYSPLGDINGSKLINSTLPKNKLETCSNDEILKVSSGAWVCASDATGGSAEDTIWNITTSNYLINLSNVLNINETKLNASIIAAANIYNETGTNLTLADKLTFAFGEIIDNIVDGWIRITGNLNVTGNIETINNVTASFFIGDGSLLTNIPSGSLGISINTTEIEDGTITDADISDITNLTLGEKITFTFGEVIDNIVNGWIRINGNLNVTGNILTGALLLDELSEPLDFFGGDAVIWRSNGTGEGDLGDVILRSTNATGSNQTTRLSRFGGVPFAQLSSSVDQNPGAANVAEVITYDTQDSIFGINHSTSVNPGEITIIEDGLYWLMPQPQVGKTSGNAADSFNMFLQVDRNGTFVKEVNSNIKLTVKDQDRTDVIVSGFSLVLNAGDKIRFMQVWDNVAGGQGLKNTNATADIPRTPSIIYSMYRIGDKAVD